MTRSRRILATSLVMAAAALGLAPRLALQFELPDERLEASQATYQTLTPHKAAHLAKQSNRVALQAQQYQQQQAANDLFPSVEPSNSATPAPDLRRGDQQLGARFEGMINGNHVRYVMPPDGFKPIIYEPERQQPANGGQEQQQRQQQQSRAQMNGGIESAGGESSESTNQLAAGSALVQITAGSSRQQQQMSAADVHQIDSQQEYHKRMGGGGLDDGEEELGDGDSQPMPLKPSIGRWSDWHDMSIEPDLASSDSRLLAAANMYSAPSSMPGTKLVSLSPSWPDTAYRTRYEPANQQAAVASQTFASSANLQQGQSAARIKSEDGQERSPIERAQMSTTSQQSARGMLPLNHRQLYYTTPSANLISIQQQQRQQHQQQQWHFSRPQYQAPFYLMSPGVVHAPVAMAAPSPLSFLLAHHQHRQAVARSQFAGALQPDARSLAQPTSFKIKVNSFGGTDQLATADNTDLHQLRHQHWPSPASSSPSPSPSSSSSSSSSSAQAAAKGQHQLVLQRQRKSKANAEVRILPLGHLQELAARREPAIGQVSAPLMSASPAAPLKKAGQQQPTLDERVFALPRVGGGKLQQPTGSQAAANNKTNGTQASPAKRVLKRRRIKTLLPVGLSSWMLGGIRDLDARHWKLPSEVMNKLAVNDVDLAHPTGDQSAGTFGSVASEDATTNISQPRSPASSSIEQAGPPLASSSTQRVPSSQLIPR